MDELVLRGMAKWPNVPAVYGWLALDRRGNWLLKGEKVTNETFAAFIGRNYGCDSSGAWFFQNGPQRVFVDLEYTPFIYRVTGMPSLRVETHTGKTSRTILFAAMDEDGSLILQTEFGIGLVCDTDLADITDALVGERGETLNASELEARLHCLREIARTSVWLRAADKLVPLHSIERRAVPLQFHFNAHPAP